MSLQNEWEIIRFHNYLHNTPNIKRREPQYISKLSNKSEIITDIFDNQKEKEDISSLFNFDSVFPEHKSGLTKVNELFDNYSDMIIQFKIDFNRQNITINGNQTTNPDSVINFIEYNIKSEYDIKCILTCCTQAIMSIPLKGIHKYYNISNYVLGEMGEDENLYDKTLYTDIEIKNNEWFIHIQKPLRLFDMYNTLYCLLIDIDVDKHGYLITIRPFN